MAGDWLKVTHALPEKPEVLAIAGRLGLTRFEVVGRLFALWRWFDNNTVDGNAVGVTPALLEECLFGVGSNAGFVAAVIAVHWLEADEHGVKVVKFDQHISESAKTRAQTANRVAKSKSKAQGNAEGNGESVTKTVPREEKRREEEPASQVVVPLPAKPAAVRGSKRCPDSFRVTADLMEWAAREAPDVALDRETANLRDHEFAKAHTDWPATWRKWMRKAQADSEANKQRNTGETAWQRSQRERVAQFSGGLADRKPTGPQPIQGDVFDVITTERLG